MLPKNNRLVKKKEFDEVFQKGKSFVVNELKIRIIFLKKRGIKNTKVGLVISRKAVKKAVARNKIKRKLRAALKEIIQNLHIKLFIVIIVFQKAEEVLLKKKSQEIGLTIKQHLKKRGIKLK